MGTPNTFGVSDQLGVGGTGLAPQGGSGPSDKTPDLQTHLRNLYGTHYLPYANAAALTASLAGNRKDGQLVLKLDDYSLWVWQNGSAAAADAQHIAPTDVGAGVGRWVQVVGSSAAVGAGGVRQVAFAQSPALLLATDRLIEVDVTGGAVTVNMDAAPVAREIHEIANTAGDASVNNITVGGNGKTVEDPNNLGTFAANVTIRVKGAEVTWEYDGAKWVIV